MRLTPRGRIFATATAVLTAITIGALAPTPDAPRTRVVYGTPQLTSGHPVPASSVHVQPKIDPQTTVCAVTVTGQPALSFVPC